MKLHEKPFQIHETMERIPRIRYRLVLEGALIGAATGGVVSVFRLALQTAESLRGSALALAGNSPGGVAGMLAVLAALCVATFLILRIEPMCSGSGIPQVKGELVGRIFMNWWRVLAAKILGGICCIGAGLSLGREGPSIQIGAMVGKGAARLTNRLATEEKLMITCGAGAGLAGAFSAPLAGVVFTLEELHKNFSTDILLATMASSISADFVAYYIFGLTPVFDLNIEHVLPLRYYWLLVLFGVMMGVFGLIYNRVTEMAQNLFARIPQPFVRTMIPFLLVIPLAVWEPEVLGSGHALVKQTADGEFLVHALIILLIAKFLFSIISFSSGAPGGIFLPLLVIGGVSGGLFLKTAGAWGGIEEMYLVNFVTYGMVGYFAAIVRSPVTGVILITEMAGSFGNFLSLSVMAFAAYVTADLLGGQPIYDQLLERMLSGTSSLGMTKQLKKQKVLLESDVYVGSMMDGGRIARVHLPEGSLIVSVVRGMEELVPNGETVLHGGDLLTVLCNEGDMERVNDHLARICRKVILEENEGGESHVDNSEL